jgi:hypothetical protein
MFAPPAAPGRAKPSPRAIGAVLVIALVACGLAYVIAR